MKTIVLSRKFTLIELFISLAIIGVVSTFLIFKTNEILTKHAFETNIKKVNNYIEYCKKIAITHQADIYFSLYQKKNGIQCEIGTDENQGIFKNQKKQEDFLKNILFTFNGKNYPEIILGCSSTGKTFPSGKLKISSKKGNFSKIIDY